MSDNPQTTNSDNRMVLEGKVVNVTPLTPYGTASPSRPVLPRIANRVYLPASTLRGKWRTSTMTESHE